MPKHMNTLICHLKEKLYKNIMCDQMNMYNGFITAQGMYMLRKICLLVVKECMSDVSTL